MVFLTVSCFGCYLATSTMESIYPVIYILKLAFHFKLQFSYSVPSFCGLLTLIMKQLTAFWTKTPPFLNWKKMIIILCLLWYNCSLIRNFMHYFIERWERHTIHSGLPFYSIPSIQSFWKFTEPIARTPPKSIDSRQKHKIYSMTLWEPIKSPIGSSSINLVGSLCLYTYFNLSWSRSLGAWKGRFPFQWKFLWTP